MANNPLGARKDAKFKAVSSAPSFNKTPVGNSTPPLPYPTVADLSNSAGVVASVRFNGQPAYVLDGSKQPDCKGDSAGTAKGVKSGTVSGEVKPVKGSPTVRVGGTPIICHGDPCTMNGGNNPGTYVTAPAPSANPPKTAAETSNPPITPEASATPQAKASVAASPQDDPAADGGATASAEPMKVPAGATAVQARLLAQNAALALKPAPPAKPAAPDVQPEQPAAAGDGVGIAGKGVTPPADPPPPDKEHVKIRVSMFFDGTLNNRTNIDQRLVSVEAVHLTDEERKALDIVRNKMSDEDVVKAKALYKKHGAPENEDTSYEGFYTNVAKMEPFVTDSPGFQNTLTIYVEGPGTLDQGGDEWPGAAFGTSWLKWKSGILEKVEKGLLEVVKKVSATYPNQTRVIIEELTLDVFGFSRGAAAARNFIHEALESSNKTLQANLELRQYTFGKKEGAVTVCFAGLYDTVSAYGFAIAAGQANNVAELHLDAVKNAKATLHLASADEHREKFALTDIESAGAKGKEFFLPGVHSDIGGGYRDNAKEEQTIFKCNSLRDAEKELERLVDAGWYRNWDENPKKVKEITLHRFVGSRGGIQRRELSVNRTGIKNHYSRIPLQIMAKTARENGMVFKVELDDEKVLSNTTLSKMEKHIESYIANTTQSKADDWDKKMETDEELRTLLRELRHDYLHFSARLKLGHDPRIEGGKRLREVFPG